MDSRKTKVSLIGIVGVVMGLAVVTSGFIGSLWLVVIVIRGLLTALGVIL